MVRAIDQIDAASDDLKAAQKDAVKAVDVSENAQRILKASKAKKSGTKSQFVFFTKEVRTEQDDKDTAQAQKDADNHEANVRDRLHRVDNKQLVLDSKKEAHGILEKEVIKGNAKRRMFFQKELDECVRGCEAARSAAAAAFADRGNALFAAQVGLELGFDSVKVNKPKRARRRLRRAATV